MPDPVLSRRALNRATLERQLLLHRVDLAPLDAVEHLVGHAGAGAAQPVHGALVAARGLPARVELSALLERREVVRIGVMRGTIHLVTADDCLLLRPLMQPVLDAELRRHGEHAPSARGRRPRAGGRACARPLLEEKPRSGDRAARALRGAVPGRSTRPRSRTPARSGSASCRCRRAGCGAGARRCARPRRSRGSAGRSSPIRRSTTVVLRYFAAFGPATVADVRPGRG